MSVPTQAIGMMGQAVPGQYGQGFPPSLGIEQAFGAQWNQQPYQAQQFGQQPYQQAQFGQGQFGQGQFGQGQFGQLQHQQTIQQLTTQILPIVYQVITTQVMQQVPQLVAQLAGVYLAQQSGQFGQQHSQGGQFPWAAPYGGSALAGTQRPYGF